jgi:hypothetical protein
LQQYYNRREWERERKEGEKFGQHKLALKIYPEMRRGGLSFKGGRQGRPPLNALQVTFMQEGAPLKGVHFRREGCALGETFPHSFSMTLVTFTKFGFLP